MWWHKAKSLVTGKPIAVAFPDDWEQQRARADRWFLELKNARPADLWVWARKDAGYPNDQELARAHLRFNFPYGIRCVRIFSNNSTIELEEHPGIEFNAVLFEPFGWR